MVLIALFATALFRMAKSGHTHQAKLAIDNAGDVIQIQMCARASSLCAPFHNTHVMLFERT